MLRVCPLGAYSHRQPLAYAPLRAACAGRIQLTDRPEQADVVVLAHARDLVAQGAHLRCLLGAGQRVVLLSEEPLWDTVWSPDPLNRHQSLPTEAGPLFYQVLNHHTSHIYAFDRIPYFLLTDTAFLARYACWFARNAALRAGDWRARMEAARLDVAFVAELRTEAKFDVAWRQAGILGLAAHRTRIALACDRGRVLRTGVGWNDLPRRQDLRDWHLEKFLDLDGACRMVSGIENTHQRHYVSEKIFDAFAVGAVPLYVADPAHRVHDLLPMGGFLNLIGLDPAQAAARIEEHAPDSAFLDCYVEAQQALAALFARVGPWRAELQRLAGTLERELQRVLSE